MPISSKLLSIMSDRKGMYYAYENDKLVGVVLLTHAEKGYSFATIEYIVVGPEAQGKGVGTRMINSIKSNPQFFINDYQGKIDAYVNSDNMPSKRAFLKNKYVLPLWAENGELYVRI